MCRDPQCDCCENWATHIGKKLNVRARFVDVSDMTAMKDEHAVPQRLRSYHTTVVDGFVIEGHVPARDVARLLHGRPAGVRGVAVPGMPIGAPGMEMRNLTQPFQVLPFGPAGQQASRFSRATERSCKSSLRFE